MEGEIYEKQVPAGALCFSVGPLELGDNGEGSKTAPFRMVARSGNPIDHWYWGRVVHDLSGMRLHKDRLTIDYVHDEKEVIGYANHFDTEDGNLNVSGALVPFKDSDRATEIIHKNRYGVPYEASIFFDEPIMTELKEGQAANVNGHDISGPATIISQWSLRGIAVCPYGADMHTSTTLSKDKLMTVKFKNHAELTEETQKTTEVVEEPAPAESVEAAPANEEAVEDKAPAETGVESVEAELLVQHTGLDYLDAYGDRGGVWYAQGKTFEEAGRLFMAELISENEALKQRLSASIATGETELLEFAADEDGGSKQGFKSKIKIAGR